VSMAQIEGVGNRANRHPLAFHIPFVALR
jgi:hypothetical protein